MKGQQIFPIVYSNIVLIYLKIAERNLNCYPVELNLRAF